jgi:DNA-binding NtrC family response regulator
LATIQVLEVRFLARILLIEDETSLRIPMGKMLRRGTRPTLTHTVVECADLSGAAAALAEGEFDLIITDVNLPDGDGIEFVRKARSDGFDGIAVIVTAFGTIETAVAAMKQGADDFLQKPLKMEELPLQTEKWLQQRKVARRLRLYERLEQNRDEGKTIVGNSAAWQECLRLADRLATMPLNDAYSPGHEGSGASLPTVLLLGETGVGKGVLARYIHQRAVAADKSRRNGSADPNDNPPFVHVNCSALPTTLVESELFGHEKGAFTDARELKAGLFEMAEGGTIFLDEISEMPLELQTKLLVVVEQGRYRRVGGTKDKHVRARIIAASNQDLEQRAADGRFRRDLLYRLNTFTVRIPPLRERKGDVALIAAASLSGFARRYGRETPRLSPGALAALDAYHWPGNVRELVNAMQRIAMLFDGETVDAADLALSNTPVPSAADGSGALGAVALSGLTGGELPKAEDLERGLVMEALRKSHGNVSRAAGMRYRVEQYGLAQFVKETAQR